MSDEQKHTTDDVVEPALAALLTALVLGLSRRTVAN